MPSVRRQARVVHAAGMATPGPIDPLTDPLTPQELFAGIDTTWTTSPTAAWLLSASDADILVVADRTARAMDDADEDLLRQARRARGPHRQECLPGSYVTASEFPHHLERQRHADKHWSTAAAAAGPWRAVHQQQAVTLIDAIAIRGRGDGTVTDQRMEVFLTGMERDWCVRSATLRARIIRGMPLPKDLGTATWNEPRKSWHDVQVDRVFGDGSARHGVGLARMTMDACLDGRVRPADLLRLASAMGATGEASLPVSNAVLFAAMDAARAAEPGLWTRVAEQDPVTVAMFRDDARWRACPAAFRRDCFEEAFRLDAWHDEHALSRPIRRMAGIPDSRGLLETCIGVRQNRVRARMFDVLYDADGSRSSTGARTRPDAIVSSPLTPDPCRDQLIAFMAARPVDERVAAATGLGRVVSNAVTILAGMHRAAVDDDVDDGEQAIVERDLPSAVAQCIAMGRNTRAVVAAWGPAAVAAHARPVDAAIAAATRARKVDLRLLAALGAMSADD